MHKKLQQTKMAKHCTKYMFKKYVIKKYNFPKI